MLVWDQSNDLVNKAETLNLVGSLSQFKGMAAADHKLLQKAEDSLKESLRIRESLLSRSDPALGQVLNTLGEFYSKQGNLTDAEEYFHRARKVTAPWYVYRCYICIYQFSVQTLHTHVTYR